MTTTRKVHELDRAECEKLLSETPIGRIGFEVAGQQMVLPVNFRWMNDAIVFRTATGKKLDAVAAEKPVAFEVDHWDAGTRAGWSVLLRGTASEIQEWDEFQEAEALGLHPWAESDSQDRWVRVIPTKITGRRID